MKLCSAWLDPIKARLPSDFSPEDSLAFQEALNAEAARRLNAFLVGVRTYQTFPAAREESQDVHVVWQEGTTRVLDYAPFSEGAVVLVIPSLVNRFAILDLDRDRSFLRYLASCGLRPLVVDWGEPGAEEASFSIEDYLTQRLSPVLAFAREKQGGKPVHLLGYCMGGVFALALALMEPKGLRSLTLLATPWDFSGGVGGVPGIATPQGRLFMQQALLFEKYLGNTGCLAASLLQNVFTGFQPLKMLEKFAGFAGFEKDSATARRFVLTEDWLNDGVPLAWPVARECLRDWYGANLTAKNEWKVGDRLIDPSCVRVPTYVLAATNDRIVPPESSLPLAKMIPDAILHMPEIGHIGLMASDSAPEKVWKPWTAWLGALVS